MASMRDIKRRKSSISSTQQITKAMKLVSTVKLQKAKSRAEQTNPYFNYMYKTVGSMLAKSGNINHPYLNSGDSKRKAVVVITSNRGLAGGYNSNVVKLITQGDFNKEDLDIYAIGGKGADMLASRGYKIVESAPEIMENPTYADAAVLCRKVLDSFTKGEVGEIYLAYTHFKNTVTHVPTLMKLLPVEFDEAELLAEDANVMMNYEVLANIYESRRNHKLDEWREFCKWIEELPYSKLICGPDFLRKDFNSIDNVNSISVEGIKEAMKNFDPDNAPENHVTFIKA